MLGMKRNVTLELRRALSGKPFLIPLVIGICLVLVSFVLDAMNCRSVYERALRLASVKDLTNPVLAANSWVGLDLQISSFIFYLLMPLLALIPYSWSLVSERENGYQGQMITRAGRRTYYFSKGVAIFVSSGAVVGLPLLLSCMLAFCAAPADHPSMHGYITLSWAIDVSDVGSWLFFNLPIAYVCIWPIYTFFAAGVWGLCVAGASRCVRHRVALLAGACVFQYAVRFFARSAYAVAGMHPEYGIDLLAAVTPAFSAPKATAASMIAVPLLYLLIGAFGLRRWSGSDVL